MKLSSFDALIAMILIPSTWRLKFPWNAKSPIKWATQNGMYIFKANYEFFLYRLLLKKNLKKGLEKKNKIPE